MSRTVAAKLVNAGRAVDDHHVKMDPADHERHQSLWVAAKDWNLSTEYASRLQKRRLVDKPSYYRRGSSQPLQQALTDAAIMA